MPVTEPKTAPHQYYFVPNELILTFEHDEALGFEERLNQIKETLVQLDNNSLMEALNNTEAQSVITTHYPKRSENRDRAISTIKLVIVGNQSPKNQSVVDILKLIETRPEIQENFTLTANWLNTPANVPLIGGGPGSRPSPAHFPLKGDFAYDTNVSNQGHETAIKARDKIAQQFENSRKETKSRAQVFILDTIPDYNFILGNQLVAPNHDGVNRLNNSLKAIVSSTYLSSITPFYVSNTAYAMPDHGIFIAGTVNRIAPTADIYLVQVLNRMGIGSLFSVIEGLNYVINNRDLTKTTIINCSFTFAIPLDSDHIFHPMIDKRLYSFFEENAFASSVDSQPENIQHFVPNPKMETWLINPLIKMLNILQSTQLDKDVEHSSVQPHENDALIFAASGNLGDNGKHPPALYPAAYNPVFGVGALANSELDRLAPYSNVADDPLTQGFLTFGGLPAQDEEMIGIYLHEFPLDDQGNRSPNIHGWAKWSGTSFATGAMSGLAALLETGQGIGKGVKLLQDAKIEPKGRSHEVHIKQIH